MRDDPALKLFALVVGIPVLTFLMFFTHNEMVKEFNLIPEPPIPVIGPIDEEPILAAARKYPAVNVIDSERSNLLMDLAHTHAHAMAGAYAQSHVAFDSRAAIMFKNGFEKPYEICAESWNWQENLSQRELWEEAFKSWSKSPGHWGVCAKKHKAYGYAMSKGRNGIWYFCIIAGD